MRATTQFAAIVIALVILGPSRAFAGPILIGGSQSWSYDGTSAGCSTCEADVVFELISGTSLKISFENTSTDWLAGVNVLTGIGFDSTPDLADLSILDQNIEGGKIWKLTGGIGGGSWEIALASKNGINNGLDNQSNLYDSGWVLLGWNSPVIGLSGLTIDASVAKFQAVGPNDASIHAYGTLEGSSPVTVGPPPVSVPEPSLLLLLATGLGVAVHRRRRNL